jgi:hypothetical protein
VAFRVLSVDQVQGVDAAGQLSDSFQITATVDGKPGQFTVTVPAAGDFVAAASAELDRVSSGVAAIYGLS